MSAGSGTGQVHEFRHDLMAQAQTGSGKTGAFALPILSKLQSSRKIECLVMVPTRELAVQVAGDFSDLAKHTQIRSLAIYGGQSINVQTDKIRKGAEVVVGTPGRIMDLMRRGELSFESVRFLVLDEADRMLDMGFIDDIEWILQRADPEGRKPIHVSRWMAMVITYPRWSSVSVPKSSALPGARTHAVGSPP